jgi:hypothetical protein
MADPKPTQPPSPQAEKISKRMKARVDKLETISDVLTEKQLPDGVIGKKLRQQRELERDSKKGVTARNKKFKDFDIWLDRQEEINNNRGNAETEIPFVKIQRLVAIDPKGKLL